MAIPIKHINELTRSAEVQQKKASLDQSTNTTTTINQAASVADPQVKPKRRYTPRRSYDHAYKMRILAAFEACLDAKERGALLRREGLYYSRVCTWRKEQASGKLKNNRKKKTLRVDHLVQENTQLKQKLAQAEAIIDLQKKVSELFGQHIRSHGMSEAS